MRSARIHSQTSDGGGGVGRAEAEAGRPLRRRNARWSWSRREHIGASSPTGCLSGCDRDGVAVEAAKKRLAEKFAGRFEIRRGIFRKWRNGLRKKVVTGVMLDLGVSSPQLDSAERGFSFQNDGPLDMRMDDRQKLTAANLVNDLGADELAKIFWEFGDERESRRIAKAIVHDRALRKFETTRQLAELIERLSPRNGKKSHPATKVFQALRIAVNDEIWFFETRIGSGGENFEAGRTASGHHVSFARRQSRKRIWPRKNARLHVQRRSGRAGIAPAARAGNEMGESQGDFARRKRIAGKSAQSQRAVENFGEN